jgi:FkbM family methyltransferase
MPPGPIVRVETDLGPMLLQADDEVITPIITYQQTWERDEAAFLRGRIRPGDTVMDVGAHVGYFTLLAAQAAGAEGRVIAIEPEPRNLELLAVNIWLHKLNSVTILPVAAGARRDVLALRKRFSNNSGSFEVHVPAADDMLLVPVVPLDEITGGGTVDVIKIDVQGTDHDVISGLEATLTASPHAPVLTEFWPDGMMHRGIDPRTILAGYRQLHRPICMLDSDGSTVPSSDEEILAGCLASDTGYVNLVLEAVSSARDRRRSWFWRRRGKVGNY